MQSALLTHFALLWRRLACVFKAMTGGYTYTSLLSLQKRHQHWHCLLATALILLFCTTSFRVRNALAGLPTFGTLTSLRYCRSNELGVGTWVPVPADAHT